MSRFNKAIAPAVATVLAVVVQWVVTGEFDRAELATTLMGLAAAATSYAVPNRDTRRVRGARTEHHPG